MFIDKSRVKMRARRAGNAWNSFMEELEQVVSERDRTECAEIYAKLEAIQAEVAKALQKAFRIC